jgi:hypothetical protein
MRHAFALAIAAVGLSGCSESVGPRPDVRSLAPSFSVAQEQDLAGSPAAILGNVGFGNLAIPAAAAADPSASGRSVVLPNAYTDMMGEQSNTFPHGVANMRYQQVFLGSELGGLRAVGGLCLRRDEGFGGPAGTQQLTFKLGPTQLDHVTLTPVFDANYSAPPTTVFSGTVTLPASSGGGTPGDFYICVDFTTPYIHPAGSNVIVEILNTSEFSLIHFEDFCFINLVCTTRRVWAFSATAPVGFMEPFTGGLVMKFNSADPQTKEDCKKGGWENYGFKNQGECIRFIETGKDSR